MKTIILLLLLLTASSASSQSLEWRSQKICEDCRPVIGWHLDSLHGSLLLARESLGTSSPFHYLYRTSDGGISWRKISDSAGVFDNLNTQDVIHPVTAREVYWRTKQYLFHSNDSGTTWKTQYMFPVQKGIWMKEEGIGIGVAQEETETGYKFQLHGTSDNGVYWYDTYGTTFESENRFSDALFLDDSNILVLTEQGKTKYTGADVHLTTDQGASWQKVIYTTSDSLFPLQLTRVGSTNVILLEAMDALLISFNHGKTWDPINDYRGRKNYRTRGWQMAGGPLVLLAAAGAIPASPTERLLEPDFELAYATELLVSRDTGRTWAAEQNMNMPQGFRIGDLQIVKDKAIVVGYYDSASFVSTADLRTTLSVERHMSDPSVTVTAFPNPAKAFAQVHLAVATDKVETLMVRDVLGRLVIAQTVSPADHNLAIEQALNPGVYFIFLTGRNGARVATTRLIVQ